MTRDLTIGVVLQIVLFVLFGRFIAPRWKVAGKLIFFFAVATPLAYSFGHWSLIWIVGHPLLGVWGHAHLCRKHGIDWITCQPRERYLELRPWAAGDGFAAGTGI